MCSSYDEDEDFEEMLEKSETNATHPLLTDSKLWAGKKEHMNDSYVVMNMTLEVKWKSRRVCSTCFAKLGSTVTDRTGTDRPTSSSQTRTLRRDLILDHQLPTLALDQ